MRKRVVFFFDENSLTESSEADVEAVITLADGRVITLPKLRGAIVCAPTKRVLDATPAGVADGNNQLGFAPVTQTVGRLLPKVKNV